MLESMAEKIAEMSYQLNQMATEMTSSVSVGGGQSFFVIAVTIFVLAAFVGYYVVWNVTPTLHSPLMSVTNAISSIIIIGAIIATQKSDTWWGFFAIIFASINIFGGFMITQRMLEMFKDKKALEADGKVKKTKDNCDCPFMRLISKLTNKPCSCKLEKTKSKKAPAKKKASPKKKPTANKKAPAKKGGKK